MAKSKLRPINETRRADGTLTSETAARLLRRRGGLARAQQLRADGFRMLDQIRLKSILTNSLKARLNKPCEDCKAFSERMLTLIAAGRDEHETKLEPEDARLLR